MRSIKIKTWTNILQFPYSPHSSLYFSFGIEKENLFNNQELLWLVIISPILMPLLFDCGMILWGEIRCSSLLGVRGFIVSCHSLVAVWPQSVSCLFVHISAG